MTLHSNNRHKVKESMAYLTKEIVNLRQVYFLVVPTLIYNKNEENTTKLLEVLFVFIRIFSYCYSSIQFRKNSSKID